MNIERVAASNLVASNLAYIAGDAEQTYAACEQFLQCLEWHLPRPTTLTPAISNIVENSSTQMLKANCFLALANLYGTLSQLVEASQALQAAEALYLTAGDPESMAHCLITRADLLRCRGRLIQSQNLLEGLQHSDSWMSLSDATKARAWFFLDTTRIYTFTGLGSKIWHWRAKFYHGGDAIQVNTHLEDLLLRCSGTGAALYRREILRLLAEVALCKGRLSDAADNLQAIIEMGGKSAENGLWSAVWKANVMSQQGDYELARELIREALEPSQFFVLRNARTFLCQSYGSAFIELTAGEYDRAESYFTATIEASDIQSDLVRKAFSICGLGEIAFARSNSILATQRFKETRSLCAEMGVPPQHLYNCFPFIALPDKFNGWVLFLEGQSPFAHPLGQTKDIRQRPESRIHLRNDETIHMV
ncbi:hypothetical protein CY34DRAFT_13697 [Suillus luteus UH-Slu-Lm8-n1]|uniref:Anaphase-promoting complex subunit 5 n=1 Tax=Suillus luteus UH-Slu-Lm8-n1 TaxID=930992 RepID=A0A0D0AR55_9AGAM|nr:hypothetical protein CY34DRAFT_13697 [Suillus luteus UH-Slu-Lm8-n1]